MFNEANGGRSKRSGIADSRGFDTLKAAEARRPERKGVCDRTGSRARRRRGATVNRQRGEVERERRVGSQSRGGRGCTMGWIDCIMYGTGLSC